MSREQIQNQPAQIKNLLNSLKDYKGKKIQISSELADDLLNDKTQGTFGEGQTIQSYDECREDIKPEEIKKLIGAVSETGFKRTFQLSEDNKILRGSTLLDAATLTLEKAAMEIFDPATQAWYENINPIVKQIAEGKTIDQIKQSTQDHELIFGPRGALNFLLAVSRIRDTFCKLETPDRHKVSLALGARTSLVIRNPKRYGPDDNLSPKTRELIEDKPTAKIYLKEGLDLLDFKNFKSAALQFETALNSLSGKTGELDAMLHFHAAQAYSQIPNDQSARNQAINHLKKAKAITHSNKKLSESVNQALAELDSTPK
ncbi:hypothetical protein KA119_00455 [Candidatus Gracilibacteria bacterium]|nr:hypothetical protein [Candidatus Gracilibacteria bacterium]